ncbi:DUF2992 family protein [Clostridium sp. MCC353]|uniref:YjdF family protein n=1 Tax=Clostridium sp. MCC353 TaxID=2592646 RepID=UPI001C033C7D|nr:YjdF family protein [Clostridium sp. MCC353]MBT9776671.1 DUF2992 family protein [Clostridium sp. MCC353]
MQKSRLTVYYNGALWIGVYERILDGRLEAGKIIFGPEPKDYEVYQFLLQNWKNLRFSPPVEIEKETESRINPKRMQRMIKKQLEADGTGTGTKSQQALKLQQEQAKAERKHFSREQKEEDRQRQFQLKQQKKKEKHRGR